MIDTQAHKYAGEKHRLLLYDFPGKHKMEYGADGTKQNLISTF